MSTHLDVHFYDQKLTSIISNLSHELQTADNVPFVEKIKAFNILITKMNPSHESYHQAITAIKLLCSDPLGNKDLINNLNADSLLYLLCHRNIDIELIMSQLSDITTSGPCSQGRCIRLLQLLF